MMAAPFPTPTDSTINRPLDAGELAAIFDAVGRDYATSIRLVAERSATDRRRCLAKTRSRYLRLLRQTLRTTEWLTDREVAS